MTRTASRGLLATAAAMTLATVAAACAGSAANGGGGQPVSASARAEAPAPATASAAPSPSPWPLVVSVPAAVAGQHQTTVRPTARDTAFQAEMTDLWAGIASGRPDLAMSSFFPLVAYEQVKAIADPAADWQNRLVAEFKQDVIAAHHLIGDRARRAALAEVIVPDQAAGWINPGVCANGVGYWHVANARMVYRVGGRIMSFGISTLISWRGRWYVVHLGGETRTSYGGMVDQPASGPGIPGPQGGC